MKSHAQPQQRTGRRQNHHSAGKMRASCSIQPHVIRPQGAIQRGPFCPSLPAAIYIAPHADIAASPSMVTRGRRPSGRAVAVVPQLPQADRCRRRQAAPPCPGKAQLWHAEAWSIPSPWIRRIHDYLQAHSPRDVAMRLISETREEVRPSTGQMRAILSSPAASCRSRMVR